MILGAHVIIYSEKAEEDRAFMRDVLGFPHADAGGGWLIFGLPGKAPAEIGFHPAGDGAKGGEQSMYLMVKDVEAWVKEMKKKKVECDEIKDQGWGIVTAIKLPSGSKMNVYQPRHPSPALGGEGGAAAGEAKPAAAEDGKAAGKRKRGSAGAAAAKAAEKEEDEEEEEEAAPAKAKGKAKAAAAKGGKGKKK